MTRRSFILHLDMLSVLDEMNEQQAGRLFKAIKAYHLRQTLEPDQDDDTGFEELVKDFVTRLAFAPFKAQFDRDAQRYDDIVDRNRRIGMKGGRPKKQNPENPSGFLENPEKPKKANSDKYIEDIYKTKNISPNGDSSTYAPEQRSLPGIDEEEKKPKRKPKAKDPPSEFPTIDEVRRHFLSVDADKRLDDWEESCRRFFDNFTAVGWRDKFNRRIVHWDSRANSWIADDERQKARHQDEQPPADRQNAPRGGVPIKGKVTPNCGLKRRDKSRET